MLKISIHLKQRIILTNNLYQIEHIETCQRLDDILVKISNDAIWSFCLFKNKDSYIYACDVRYI